MSLLLIIKVWIDENLLFRYKLNRLSSDFFSSIKINPLSVFGLKKKKLSNINSWYSFKGARFEISLPGSLAEANKSLQNPNWNLKQFLAPFILLRIFWTMRVTYLQSKSEKVSERIWLFIGYIILMVILFTLTFFTSLFSSLSVFQSSSLLSLRCG